MLAATETYDALIQWTPDDLEADENTLQGIGVLIDLASDLGRIEGARHGIALAEALLERDLSSPETALLHYFLGNAWSHIQVMTRREQESDWDWEQAELESQLLHFRLSLRDTETNDHALIRRCQALTNLGNLFSQVGRFIEAVRCWDEAIGIIPEFGMALANRGRGLYRFAAALYDDGHQHIFLQHAQEGLRAGLECGTAEHAAELFQSIKAQLDACVSEDDFGSGPEWDDSPLGDTNEERRYRQWCLDNCLFLNPLNDLGPFSVAARDVFSNPSMRAAIGEGPTFHGLFNQLKQDFVSARYLYYEGVTSEDVHFSDRDVLLHNTLDYPIYSLAAEKVKIALRVVYSLFDKVAYFLNDYLSLEIPDRRVTFRTIWYAKQNRKNGLREECERFRNWPLRGLFWLSKDLFEDSDGFREALDPDAQELREIRNHAEHKYLKVHEAWSPPLSDESDGLGFGDRLAYSIGRDDLESRTLCVLRLAREALIYLSLGVHEEEQRRHKDDEGLVMPGFLDVWEDEWKS